MSKNNTNTIKHNQIKFKKININDLEKIKNWRNLENIRNFNYQYTLLNMKNQRFWYESLKQNSDKIMFLVLKNSLPIGICGLIDIDFENKTANVAIIVGETRLHGKGYGSLILKKLVDYGFIKLNLHRIGADIFEYNLISVKLFEKASFKKEATLRQSLWRHNKWWNVYVYSIINPGFMHNL